VIGYDRRGALSEACTREIAARYLGVSPGRISQMMDSGEIGYIVVGRRRFPSWPAVQGIKQIRDMVTYER
jgi:excisionase family DNA binding protein